MPKFLTCPQGHQWEIQDRENAPTTDVRVLCPICGAAVELVGPDFVEESTSEALMVPTFPIKQGAIPSEAATIEPNPDPATSAESDPIPDEVPTHLTIPGFEILEELGRGGMGVVYKALQTKLDRLVALKVLPHQTTSDAAFAERFGREARALAKLNHPNIVTVYDFGQAERRSYFIMEYVDGSNLRQRLRARRLEPQEAMEIVTQICDALQYAHDERIVHRDIKPENILLDKKGRVKIADFGIAKLLARKTGDYTLTGPWQVLGTLHYMAPEQLENSLTLDHRADIYSLGVMFYEMLTGELPLGRFALPSQKVPVDARFDEVVLRALEKEPQRRYQQVSEFRMAIQSLGNEAGSLIHDGNETNTAIDPSGRGSQLQPTTSMFSTRQALEQDKLGHRQNEAAVFRAGGCLGAILGGIIGAILGFLSGFGDKEAKTYWWAFCLFGAVAGIVVGRFLAGFYVGYVTAEKKSHPRHPDANAQKEGHSPKN